MSFSVSEAAPKILSSHTKSKLSLLDRVKMAGGLAKVGPVLPVALVATPLTAASSPLPFGKHFQNTRGRAFVSHLDTRFIQQLLDTSERAYRKFAGKHGFPPVINTFTESRVFWIGDRTKAKKILLWSHGGGFAIPLGLGHLELSRRLVEQIPGLAVALLEYELSPAVRYPRPFEQAVDALNGLLKEGYARENIFIGGDSAGGHITLSVMSHLLHKHPNIPEIASTGKFAGFILCSPCVTDKTDSHSMKESHYDVIRQEHVERWTNVAVDVRFVEANEDGVWAAALETRRKSEWANWWQGLGELSVGGTLVTVGGMEVFRDDVVLWVDGVKKNNYDDGKLVLCEAKEETHEAPILDCEFGRAPGESERQIMSWIAQRMF